MGIDVKRLEPALRRLLAIFKQSKVSPDEVHDTWREAKVAMGDTPDTERPVFKGTEASKTNHKHILLYLTCRMCALELPAGESLATYSRINGGWTKDGYQSWCVRHNLNIVHIDFQGQTHPADLTACIAKDHDHEKSCEMDCCAMSRPQDPSRN